VVVVPRDLFSKYNQSVIIEERAGNVKARSNLLDCSKKPATKTATAKKPAAKKADK
jgi:hypothetical protein